MLSRRLQWWVLSSLLFGILQQVAGPESSSSRSNERHFPARWPKNWYLQSRIHYMSDREVAKWGQNSMSDRKFADAIYCYSKAIEKNPNEASYYKQRGKCYLEVNDLEMAISNFAKSIEVNPQEDVYLFQSTVVKFGKLNDEIKRTIALINPDEIGFIADRLLDDGKFEEALYCFDEAIKKNSSQSRLYRQRAVCYQKMEKPEMALSDYRESLKLDPQDRLTINKFRTTLLEFGTLDEPTRETLKRLNAFELVNIANLFRGKKKFEEALFCYNEAIKKDDSDEKNYAERAYCYKEMGNREMALRDYGRAVRIKPNRSDYLQYFKETMLFEFDRFNETITETFSVLDPFHLQDFGNYFFDRNKFEEALFCYNAAIEKKPQALYNVYIQRGKCYSKMKNFRMAISDFRKSMHIRQLSASDQIDFCEILVHAGEYRIARKLLENLDTGGLTVFYKQQFKKIREEAKMKEREHLAELTIYLKKLIIENTNRRIRQLQSQNKGGAEVRRKINELQLKQDGYLEELTSAIADYEQIYKESVEEESDKMSADDEFNENMEAESDKKDADEELNILLETPEYLCGTITLEIMTDPVVAPTGITYERTAIESYLERKGVEPVSSKPLSKHMLIPNRALNEALKDWKTKNTSWSEKKDSDMLNTAEMYTEF